jgi:hypothetical protein
MRYSGHQFGSFDARGNRKTLLDLFGRLGSDERRANFLQGLIAHSRTGMAGKLMQVNLPCSSVQAYLLFVAITGCLGVQVEEAANKLEAEVSKNGCPGTNHR